METFLLEMSRENFPGVKEVTGETKMKVFKLNFLAMSQKQRAHANFFMRNPTSGM